MRKTNGEVIVAFVALTTGLILLKSFNLPVNVSGVSGLITGCLVLVIVRLTQRRRTSNGKHP